MITREQAISILSSFQQGPTTASDEDHPRCVLCDRQIDSGILYFRLNVNDGESEAACADCGDEHVAPGRRIGTR